MVQFKYDGIMKRYNVKVPFTLADESDVVTVASISEDEESKITLHREVSIKLLKTILLSWDEYKHQQSRELDELLEDNNECKHLMNPDTCMACEEEKGDK